MSLTSLRAMRINRQKPTDCVQVVVGDRPKNYQDSEATVYIGPLENPSLMDFRPLVGLRFVLFQIGNCSTLALATLDAAAAAGGRCVAASLPDGIHAGINFDDSKDVNRLTYWVGQSREALCQ